MSISNNNVASREISLRVEDSYKEDTYKLIARVDPETLEELEATLGDILLIQNPTKPRRKAVAQALRLRPTEEGKGIIRINSWIHRSLGVGVDDRVVVRKAEVKPARHVVIAPITTELYGRKIYFEKEFKEQIKRYLLNKPLISGMLLHIQHAWMSLLFCVVKTSPLGPVIVNTDTNVALVDVEEAEFYQTCFGEQPPEQSTEFTGDPSSVLKEIKDELRDIGLENFIDDILNALRVVYISKEFCAGKDNNMIKKISPEILSILKGLNLVYESEVRTTFDRLVFMSPTSRGERIGQAIIIDAINKHKEELNKLIEEHAPKVWLILKASLKRFPPDILPPQTLIIYELERVASKSEGDKSLLEILMSTYESHLSFASEEVLLPETLFAKFVSKTVLGSFAINFFKQLENMGLAVQDLLYDKEGKILSEVYKAPKEVFDYFMDRVKPPDNLEQCIQRLSAYYVIAKVSRMLESNKPPDAIREEFNELLQVLEVSENTVAEVLEEMNKKRITSRLIKRPDALPFIVLNKKAFEEYLVKKIEEVANCD